jgi:hypothetical protein
MVEIVESLSESTDWQPGDRVKTLRGSLRGVIVRLLDDGRVAWRPDGTENDLIALPKNLLPAKEFSQARTSPTDRKGRRNLIQPWSPR